MLSHFVFFLFLFFSFLCFSFLFFFFFNDTATTEIYTLSLHDALPISFIGENIEIAPKIDIFAYHEYGLGFAIQVNEKISVGTNIKYLSGMVNVNSQRMQASRSEEHTSELQSRLHLVCRLLLEKKKTNKTKTKTK